MIGAILDYLQAHPIVTIALLFIGFRIFSMMTLKEVVIEGSRVEAVESHGKFKEELKNNKIVIADFYANWCPGCVHAAPEYAKLSKRYQNVKFIKINTDKAGDIASAYQIQALPTFKIFANKKEVTSLVGFDKHDMIAKLESAGAVATQE
jgi:thioredoxin 1